MLEKEVTVVNKMGVHARPASMLVNTVNKYDAAVFLIKDDMKVDARSIMSVLQFAAAHGTRIRIVADGTDEQRVVEELVALFASKFGEE